MLGRPYSMVLSWPHALQGEGNRAKENLKNLSQTGSRYRLPLNSPNAALPLVGGKALNLGRLVNGGFRVPEGFTVAVPAYTDFISGAGLAGAIVEGLASIDADDPAALAAHSERLRTRINEGAKPDGITAAIRASYAALGRPPVAVRSSATAEDLPEMSFAGQHDTFLNIQGENGLLAAVAGCWSSLWTARAFAYRTRNNIDHLSVAIAVVVQTMVPSESSGVLFTANPLTGRRLETVIDATVGLGEPLVSGQIEPDHFVVESNSAQILQKQVGAKAKAMHGKEGGGLTTTETANPRRQAIEDSQIRSLTETGQQIAAMFGSAQDIEWAYADGELYLLQSRPITSLFPIPPHKGDVALRVFVSLGAIQGVQGPFTPMGQEMIRGLFAGLAQLAGYNATIDSQALIRIAGERPWVDATAALRNDIGRRIFLRLFPLVEPGAADAVRELAVDPRLQGGGMRPVTIRRVGPFVSRMIRSLAGALPRPEAAAREARRTVETHIEEAEERTRTAHSLAGRVEICEQLCYHQVFPVLVPLFMPLIVAGMASLSVLHRLASILAQAGEDVQPRTLFNLNRSLPNSVTTEMDQALWQVAKRVQEDRAGAAAFVDADPHALARDFREGKLHPAAQTPIADFLARYGMRGPAEIDFGQPRWREDPAPLIGALQALLTVQDPDAMPDTIFRAGQTAAARAQELLANAASRRFGTPWGAGLVRWLAKSVRTLAGFRESPKFAVIRMMGIARAALLESGRELVEAGVLDSAGDLFFLQMNELKVLAMDAPGDWRRLVQMRRAAYQRERRRQPIPRLLLSDGTAVVAGGTLSSCPEGGLLIGSGVSPGTVEGTARVVFDPARANLQPGEILVCPGADPSWTPLFLAAGGLVMEVGGMMTHGSVVAREYGIPAVAGVARATEILRSGQRLRVNGSSGRVALLDRT